MSHARGKGPIEAIVFDVGETLLDETRSWALAAREAGVTPFTLFAAIGALIERGADHREVWDLVGAQRPRDAPEIELADFYPDAIPCCGPPGRLATT